MATPPIWEPMPKLPRCGQKVRWRDPILARDSGWEEVFGPGPFAVFSVVDNSNHGLATSLILRTELGD
jgi:hypothetical protein